MRHTYSTDSPERQQIPFFIAAAAVACAYGISHILEGYGIDAPGWLSPLDTMTFYGLFYWLFDGIIWKWGWVHRIKITHIPDLSGEWSGVVDPTPTGGVSAGLVVRTDITLSIRQTWTRMLVTGRTKQSRSRSLTATLVVLDECSVSYEYLSEPLASAAPTMHMHRGTARLSLSNDGTVLEGEYYSGRGRQNVGIIRLTRPSEE